MNQHATALIGNEIGFLLVGAPASGKSELAWQLIQQHDARLIADDQVILSQHNNQWYAECPETIRNKIHLRGAGVIDVKSVKAAPIKIIFQSPLPAFPLSQPPKINIPVVMLDFKAENAAESLLEHLRGLTG